MHTTSARSTQTGPTGTSTWAATQGETATGSRPSDLRPPPRSPTRSRNEGQGLQDFCDPRGAVELCLGTRFKGQHQNVFHEPLLNPVQHLQELECQRSARQNAAETRHSGLPPTQTQSAAQEHRERNPSGTPPARPPTVPPSTKQGEQREAGGGSGQEILGTAICSTVSSAKACSTIRCKIRSCTPPPQQDRLHKYIENTMHGSEIHDQLHCAPLNPFLRIRPDESLRPHPADVFLIQQLE